MPLTKNVFYGSWRRLSAPHIVHIVFYDHLEVGQFERIDAMLSYIDISRFDTSCMVAFLTTTLHAKDRLPARKTLYGQIDGILLEMKPDERVAILHGLK